MIISIELVSLHVVHYGHIVRPSPSDAGNRSQFDRLSQTPISFKKVADPNLGGGLGGVDCGGEVSRVA